MKKTAEKKNEKRRTHRKLSNGKKLDINSSIVGILLYLMQQIKYCNGHSTIDLSIEM